MTRYPSIVVGMTQTMKHRMLQWRRRTGVAAVGATFAVAMVFGPCAEVTSRLGASETVGYATVSAADTITSMDLFAEVAAAGRRVSNGLQSV
jgi:hypothetical protein